MVGFRFFKPRFDLAANLRDRSWLWSPYEIGQTNIFSSCRLFFFTRRRSFAEYWKYFVARLNDVHAFGYNSAWVNGFGRNLGNSEYIVSSWPWQILGAICAEARAGELAEFLFFFVRQITHDFADFQSAKFHEICTQDVVLRLGEFFRNRFMKIRP